MDVLDSVTLQRLQTLESPQGTPIRYRAVIFSPDSRILTCSSGGSVGHYHQCQELSVVSWDLQTGGVASVIRWKGPQSENAGKPSITYSANGKMVAVFCFYPHGPGTSIFIFDVASGIHMHSHSLNNLTPLVGGIWTYGESLRFATVRLGSIITIWGVGFTSGATPTEVETLPAVDGHHYTYGGFRLLPAPCRFALNFGGGVLVHDVRNSKRLLYCTSTWTDCSMSFSPDGRFFACSAGSKVYLWKESPTGYILQEILEHSAYRTTPLLSPNGESIVVFGDHTIQLSRTKSSIAIPSSIPTRAPQPPQNFILGFSPDGTLAAVARRYGKTVMVLNIKSGVLQLTINPGMAVDGLGVIGNTVVVIGFGKAITWNLPAGDHAPDVRIGLEESSRILGFSRWSRFATRASISPDSRYVAVITGQSPRCLSIYSTSTGLCIGETSMDGIEATTRLWFSPDGCDIWCVRDNSKARRVRRVSGGLKGLEVLDSEWHTVDVEGYPWRPSHGYQVTTDWWILDPDGKRLLMLPPPWQSYPVHRVWNGRFLALLHSGLSEPVILELNP